MDENKEKSIAFTTAIDQLVGGNDLAPHNEIGQLALSDDWEDPELDSVFMEEFGTTINDPKLNEADKDFTPDLHDDTYLNMELALPREDAKVQLGRVVKRLRDKDGLPIGTVNDKPILDTRIYEVEFQDRHEASTAANAIAENLFSQIDDEENRHVLFDEIADHRTNGRQVTKVLFVLWRNEQGLDELGTKSTCTF
jgi:hypothetical protein